MEHREPDIKAGYQPSEFGGVSVGGTVSPTSVSCLQSPAKFSTMDDAILEEQPVAFGPAYASVYRQHTTNYRPEPEPEVESMPEEGNVHDWYAALNETRREAREHTDSITGEIRSEMREDRREILGAIRDSQTMVLEQINQVAGDLSNTRSELHRDITSVRDIAEGNAREVLEIKTFGRALLIFISIVGTISAVAAAVGGFF